MAQPQGIVGDISPTELPITQLPENDLTEEKKMARFSKTEEFKRLKTYIEDRISFYQQYLPDGRPVGTVSEDVSELWKASNIVVGEFKALIDAYEQAKEAVDGQ